MEIDKFCSNKPEFENISSAQSDPDNDGFINAAEYAFGTSPTNDKDLPLINYTLINMNEDDYLGITFKASSNALMQLSQVKHRAT